MANYTKTLAANFGATKSGQAANVGYTVRDSARNVLIPKTVGTLVEAGDYSGTANTGNYRGKDATFDDSWSGFIEYTIEGFQGVSSVEDFGPPVGSAVWSTVVEDGGDDGITLTSLGALSVAAAWGGGTSSGFGSRNVAFNAAGNPNVTRITATVDGNGNRQTVVLTPPE